MQVKVVWLQQRVTFYFVVWKFQLLKMDIIAQNGDICEILTLEKNTTLVKLNLCQNETAKRAVSLTTTWHNVNASKFVRGCFLLANQTVKRLASHIIYVISCHVIYEGCLRTVGILLTGTDSWYKCGPLPKCPRWDMHLETTSAVKTPYFWKSKHKMHYFIITVKLVYGTFAPSTAVN